MMVVVMKFFPLFWMTILSIQLIVQSLITSAISTSTSLSSSSLRGQPIQQQQHRSLEEITGTEACSSCKSNEGYKCVGRTVQDENCDECSKGQTFWPCNLKKECWCWDTSKARDPGDNDGKDHACSGCGRDNENESCVSNQNSLIPVGDEECTKCMEGQSFWPCDDPDLCWCWDSTKPKKPPAPASGLSLAKDIDPNVPSPCEILTQDMFMKLAPNSTFPYTYEGLCNAIDDYNTHHTEKFAAMGTEEHIRAEIAAFLGNTAHESDDFEAAREYLACGDRKEVDGKVYCKPCNNDLYDWPNNVCSVSMVDQNAPYNSYCQPSFEPPEGCVCDTITQVEEEGPLAGYVEASKVFYGRGAIQLSWNYNYIRASYALTGSAETFCNDPEQVALKPEYAWGSGIYFWMENEKEGSTCHKEALKGDFGGTLNNINGGLECPAYKGGWHADAIKMRLNRYCNAASQLGMEAISSLGGCKGMEESYEECLGDGHCPYCEQYAGVETVTFTNTETETEQIESESETATDARPVPIQDTDEEVADEPPSRPTPISGAPTPVAIDTTSTSTETPTLSIPAVEQSSSPTEAATPEQSSQLTVAPTTRQPSVSPGNNPTQQPTTIEPSYTPTTPQPTMGPCDGESCPGDMCRSAFGFCGTGEFYCTDKAIWSPECKLNSKPPSPSPTMTATNEPTSSPAEKETPVLNEVFSVTREPISEEVTADTSPSTAGTAEPSPSSSDSFAKPSGGKKPGGKPKPESSTSSPQQASDTAEMPVNTSSPTPSSVTPARTREPTTPLPTLKTTEKEYSPTDPESTYFCGLDWADANTCNIRCPSSKSDECPQGQKCFAFTSCMEQQPEDDTQNPTYRPTDPSFTNEPVTPSPVTPASTTPAPSGDSTKAGEAATFDILEDTKFEVIQDDTATKPEGCTGTPCPFAGECRSQYGFCGLSFIYVSIVLSFNNCLIDD